MKEEKIRIMNPKNQVIASILHEPDNKTGSAVLMVHGFKGNKDEHGGFITAAKEFCGKGFMVLRIDCIGSGDSDGKFEDMTISSEVEDVLTAIDFLKNRGIKKICLLGNSLGGSIVILAANKRRNIVKTVIGWSPVIFLQKQFERRVHDNREDLEKKGYAEIWSSGNKKYFKVGKKFFDETQSLHPEDIISKSGMPFLIVHGDSDTTVNIEDSEKIISESSNSNKLVVVKGAEHTFHPGYPKYHLKQFIDASLEWLNEHVK